MIIPVNKPLGLTKIISPMPKATLYPTLMIILLGCSILTLVLGDIPWPDVWNEAIMRLQGASLKWNPFLDERLPRLIVIISTGAALAVSGAVMQGLFHNPLASPHLLGISCGGALFVVLVFIFKWHLQYPFSIPLAAFTGSLLTLFFVYLLSRSDGKVQIHTLILTGIAVSSFLLAIQASIMYAFRENWTLIQTLTEWEVGSTLDRNWKHVHMQLPITIIGLYGCWHYRNEIDILTLGEDQAKNLGVDVDTVRWRLFLCVALLTGGAIAAVGMVAFFGLVLPHLVRRLQGPSSQGVIPLCMLLGSVSFAGMDLLLRVLKIHNLSIGNISAILGGIAFLVLLRKFKPRLN